LGDLGSDLVQAARALRHRPGPALAIVATLGVAIGGATAIFSFVDGVLLRPLDYPESDRIVALCETHPDRPGDWCAAAPPDLADWLRESRTLAVGGLARGWSFSMKSGDRLEHVRAGVATPGFFETFGARAALGRTFEPRDLKAGAPRSVVLTYDYWRARFGGDPGELGRSLELDGEPHTVVGVLPQGFAPPEVENRDLWVPLWPERVEARWWRGFGAWARLADGARMEDARAELGRVAEQLSRDYPDTNAGWGVRVESLHDHTVGGVRPALLALLAAVLLVLLVACANVANLLLVQATVRERELALRAAIGAGSARLARLVVAEGLLLAAAGGALGSLVAAWAVELFRHLAPGDFPRIAAVEVDASALAFASLASLLTCALFSLAPVLRSTRLDLRGALSSARSGGERPGSRRLRDGLAAAELALALVLLVGGGLLARSLWNLADWRPGFDREGLLMVQAFPPHLTYPEDADLVSYYRRAVEELAALPGVVSASAGSAGPLFGGDGQQELYPEDRPVPPAGARPLAYWYDVAPGYFRTLGVPLVRGREFEDRDGPGAPPVAIVNESLARRVFGGEDPLGRRLHLVTHDMTVEVVGVVRDTLPFRPGASPQPEIYWPVAQVPRWAVHFVMRSAVPPGRLAASVRERLAALDPDVYLSRPFTLGDQVEGQLVTPRFQTALLAGFALLATGIAAVGVYGVVAFAVGRRTREIGLRLALGARPRDVLLRVLGGAVRLALFGLAAGAAAALGAMRLLSSLLVGVGPADPPTLLAAAAALGLLSLVASLTPALRAARVDPAIALRHD